MTYVAEEYVDSRLAVPAAAEEGVPPSDAWLKESTEAAVGPELPTKTKAARSRSMQDVKIRRMAIRRAQANARKAQHPAPEPEPEPERAEWEATPVQESSSEDMEPMGAAEWELAQANARKAQQQAEPAPEQDFHLWSVLGVATWLRSLDLPTVAEAASAEGVDGATALEMDKDDWRELGAAGVKAAKIVGAVKKLASFHGAAE